MNTTESYSRLRGPHPLTNQMEDVNQTTASRTPQVNRELQELIGVKERMANVAALLAKKLEPIQRPVPGDPSTKGCPAEEREVMAPLARVIAESTGSLNRTAGMLEELLHRVEI